MLSVAAYLLATIELIAILAAATLGATSLRRRLAPELEGPAAHLATAILAVATLIAVAELLGTFGLFKEWLFAATTIAAGLLLRSAFPRSVGPPESRESVGSPQWVSLTEESRPIAFCRIVGIALAAIAVAHFTIGVRLRLSTGMTGFDSTWYHGPFAAGFAQSGNTFDLQLIAPQFLAWFYPQNSELLHGIGDLVYGRDILSPLINVVWLLGCLAAAWAIGRPYGAAPVSLAGAALILDTGVLADQAGEARNDLAGAFFLLAAVAIMLNAAAGPEGRRPRLGALAVCALAAGLAAGTKVNLLPPAIALVVALVWLAPSSARRRSALVLGLAGLAGGSYWYLRNLLHSGNPVPQIRHLGPIDLPGPDQPLGGREGHGVLSYLFDGSIWSDWFGPGLHAGLGLLWPAIALLCACGLIGCLLRRSEPALRAAAIAGIVAAAAWVLAPTSASGPDGMPRGFESGLRYLVPALLLGAVLAPLAPALRAPRRRWGLLIAIVVLFGFADRSAGGWASGYVAAAVLAGLAIAAVALFLTWPGRRPLPRRYALVGSAAVITVGLAAGYKVQRTYLENRYADPQFTVAGLDAAFRWAQPLSGERIATTTTRTYPLLGRDLSNRVRFVGIERPQGGFVATRTCREWLSALRAGDYDYVVASLDRSGGSRAFPPQAAWTAADPAARVILRRSPTVVFRLDGTPDPASCGSPAR